MDQSPILNEATAQKKFSCPSCGGEARQFVAPFPNPNGIGIIQPSVAAQRLRWGTVQTIQQL
jgi:hypothetical protein